MQQIKQKSTEFLRRIFVPVHLQGGAHCRTCAVNATAFRVVFNGAWRQQQEGRKKQCNWWCAACGGQYNWEDLNRVLVAQDSTDPSEAKVLRAQAPPAGSVREPRVCTQVVGDPAYGRRPPGGHDL